MRVSVVSLHRAVRPLLVPQGARVETVHRRAVNLRLDSGPLVTLCAPALGNGPGALVVAADWPLPWQVGERLAVSTGEIRGARCTVAVSEASAWEPDPLPVLGTLALVRQGWRLALRELPEAKTESPFLDVSTESCTELAHSARLCGVPERGSVGSGESRAQGASAAELTRQLARPGLSALQSADWTEAVACLVGLGPGLTPSGDDLLVGFLLLAHRSGWSVATPLREAIRACPPGRTTPVSESLLHWATEGVANERALHWLDGLLQGAPPPLDPVLAIGATSGADFAAGALLALDLFLKERAA